MSSAEKIKRLFAKSNVTVNPKVDDKIISDALTAFNKPGKTRSISAGPNAWRMIMKTRTTKIAAIAAIVITAFVVINQFGGSVNVSTVGWADVLRNIEAAQTVTFTLESKRQYNDDEHEWGKGTIRIKGPWRRYDGNDGHRYGDGQSNEETIISVMDTSRQNRFMLLYPLKKCAYTADDHGGNEALFTYDGLSKDFRDGTEEDVGEAEIDGRKVFCFKVTKDNSELTVWADPDTAFPVRMERRTNDGSEKIILSNITFGAELDDQLFDMTVPEDCVAVNMSTEEFTIPFELTEKYLVEGLAAGAKSRGGKFPALFVGGRPGKEARDKHMTESQTAGPVEDGFSGMLAAEYVKRLPEGSDWQYVGEDVKLGDATKAVCWWKPAESDTYRVIYGDLSVRDVKPEDLPEVPWPPRRK